jgi:acetyl esterase/lipase
VYSLLALGVAAPEIAPLLLVAALLLGLFSTRSSGPSRLLALLLCGATAALCCLPLVQIRPTQAAFNAAAAGLDVTPPPPSESVSVTRGIAFAEPDGQALTLDIYRPTAERAFPIVIQIYGGAWRSGTPGDDAAFATALARTGYVVISIDYRHAPQAHWPAQIDDVRNAIDWVVAHGGEYGGDVRRMALLGRSSGAQLALVAAYMQPALFAAVVDFYGPTNLAAGWQEPPSPDPLPVRPVLEAFLGGRPEDVPENYAAASPVTYVSKRVPPTLLIYGARDHVVEARFGSELHERLTAAGVASIYLELPWAEHSFDQLPGLSAWVVRPYVERFLAKYLK